MKLSDVRGERALDVIADIAAPVARIVASDGFKAVIDGARGGDTEAVASSVPQLIKGNKEDLLAILSAIAGVSRDEYVEGMTLASVIADVVELLTDDAFTDFLGSAT